MRQRQLEASLRSREAQLADAMKAEQRQWNETSAQERRRVLNRSG
jgi:acyl-CoA reductase-like NAD-dependent aldehyde dehydrogenase